MKSLKRIGVKQADISPAASGSEPSVLQPPQSNPILTPLLPTKFETADQKGLQASFEAALEQGNHLREGFWPPWMEQTGRPAVVKQPGNPQYDRFTKHIGFLLSVLDDQVKVLATAGDEDDLISLFKKLWVNSPGVLTGITRVWNPIAAEQLSTEAARLEYFDQHFEDSRNTVVGYLQQTVRLYRKFGADYLRLAIASHDVFKAVDDTTHVQYSVKTIIEMDRAFKQDDFQPVFQEDQSGQETFWQKLSEVGTSTDQGQVFLNDPTAKSEMIDWIDQTYSGEQAEQLKALMDCTNMMDFYQNIIGEKEDIFLPTLYVHQVLGASFTNTSYTQLLNFVSNPDDNLNPTEQKVKAAMARVLADPQKLKDMIDFLEILTIVDTAGVTKEGFISQQVFDNYERARGDLMRILSELVKDVPNALKGDARVNFIETQVLVPHHMAKVVAQIGLGHTQKAQEETFLDMVGKMVSMYVPRPDESEFQERLASTLASALKELSPEERELIQDANLILDQQYINTYSAALLVKRYRINPVKTIQNEAGESFEVHDFSQMDISDLPFTTADMVAVLRYNLLYARYAKLSQGTVNVDQLGSYFDNEANEVDHFVEALVQKGLATEISPGILRFDTGKLDELDVFLDSIPDKREAILSLITGSLNQLTFLVFSAGQGNVDFFTSDEVAELSALPSDQFFLRMNEVFGEKKVDVSSTSISTVNPTYGSEAYQKAQAAINLPGTVSDLDREDAIAVAGGDRRLEGAIRTCLSLDSAKAQKRELKAFKKLRIWTALGHTSGGLSPLLDSLVKVRSLMQRGFREEQLGRNVNARKLNAFYEAVQEHGKVDDEYLNDALSAGGLASGNNPNAAEQLKECLIQAGCIDESGAVLSGSIKTIAWNSIAGIDKANLPRLQRAVERMLSNVRTNQKLVELIDRRVSTNTPTYLPQIRNKFLLAWSNAHARMATLLFYLSFVNLALGKTHPSAIMKAGQAIFTGAMGYFAWSTNAYMKNTFIDARVKAETMMPELDRNPLRRMPGITGHSGWRGVNKRNRLGYFWRQLWYGPHAKESMQFGSADFANANVDVYYQVNGAKLRGKVMEKMLRRLFGKKESVSRYTYGEKREVEGDDWLIWELAHTMAYEPIEQDGMELLSQSVQTPRYGYDPKSWGTRGIFNRFFNMFTEDPDYRGGVMATERTLVRLLAEMEVNPPAGFTPDQAQKIRGIVLDNMRSILDSGDLKDFVVNGSCIDLLKSALGEAFNQAKLTPADLNGFIEYVNAHKDDHLYEVFAEIGSKATNYHFKVNHYIPGLRQSGLDDLTSRAICKDFLHKCRDDHGAEETVANAGQKLLHGLTLSDDEEIAFLDAMQAKFKVSKEKGREVIALISDRAQEILDVSGHANQRYQAETMEARRLKWSLEDKFATMMPDDNTTLTRTLLYWEKVRDHVLGLSVDEQGRILASKDPAAEFFKTAPTLFKQILGSINVPTNQFNTILKNVIQKKIYRCLSAHKDPQTIRIYEATGSVHITIKRALKDAIEQFEQELLIKVMSAGNKQAEAWYRNLRGGIEGAWTTTQIENEVKKYRKWQKLNEKSAYFLPIAVTGLNAEWLAKFDPESNGRRVFIHNPKKPLFEHLMLQEIGNLPGMKYASTYSRQRLNTQMCFALADLALNQEDREELWTTGKILRLGIEIKNIQALSDDQIEFQLKKQWEAHATDLLEHVAVEFLTQLRANGEIDIDGKPHEEGKKIANYIRAGQVRGIAHQAADKAIELFQDTLYLSRTAAHGYMQSVLKNDDVIDELGAGFRRNDYELFRPLFDLKYNPFAKAEQVLADATGGPQGLSEVFKKLILTLEEKSPYVPERERLKAAIKDKESKLETAGSLNKNLLRNEIARLQTQLENLTPEKFVEYIGNLTKAMEYGERVGVTNRNDGKFMYYGHFFSYDELKNILFGMLFGDGDMTIEKDGRQAIYKTRQEAIYQTVMGRIDDDLVSKEKALYDLKAQVLHHSRTEDEKDQIDKLEEELHALQSFRDSMDTTLAVLGQGKKFLEQVKGGRQLLEDVRAALNKQVDAIARKEELMQNLVSVVRHMRVDTNDMYRGKVSTDLTLQLPIEMYQYLKGCQEPIRPEQVERLAQHLMDNKRTALLHVGTRTLKRGFQDPATETLIAMKRAGGFTHQIGVAEAEGVSEAEKSRLAALSDRVRTENNNENTYRVDFFHITGSDPDSLGRKGGLWNNLFLGNQQEAQMGNLTRRATEQYVLERSGQVYINPRIQLDIDEKIVQVIQFPVDGPTKRRELGITAEKIYDNLLENVIRQGGDIAAVVNQMVDSWGLTDDVIYPGSGIAHSGFKRKATPQDIKDRLIAYAQEMAVSYYALNKTKGLYLAMREIQYQSQNADYVIEGTDRAEFKEAVEVLRNAGIEYPETITAESLARLGLDDAQGTALLALLQSQGLVNAEGRLTQYACTIDAFDLKATADIELIDAHTLQFSDGQTVTVADIQNFLKENFQLQPFSLKKVEKTLTACVDKNMRAGGQWAHLAVGQDKGAESNKVNQLVQDQIRAETENIIQLARLDEKKIEEVEAKTSSIRLANSLMSMFFNDVLGIPIARKDDRFHSLAEKVYGQIKQQLAAEGKVIDLKQLHDRLMDLIKKAGKSGGKADFGADMNFVLSQLKNFDTREIRHEINMILETFDKRLNDLEQDHMAQNMLIVNSLLVLEHLGVATVDQLSRLNADQISEIIFELNALGYVDRYSGKVTLPKTINLNELNDKLGIQEKLSDTGAFVDKRMAWAKQLAATICTKHGDLLRAGDFERLGKSVFDQLQKDLADQNQAQLIQTELFSRNPQNLEAIFKELEQQLSHHFGALQTLNFSTKVQDQWIGGRWYTQTSRRHPRTSYQVMKQAMTTYWGDVSKVRILKVFKGMKRHEWAVFDAPRTAIEIVEGLSSQRAGELPEGRLPRTKLYLGENAPYMDYLEDMADVLDEDDLVPGLDDSVSPREMGNRIQGLLGQVSKRMKDLTNDDGSQKYDPLRHDYARAAVNVPNAFDDLDVDIEMTDPDGRGELLTRSYRTPAQFITSLDVDNQTFRSFHQMAAMFDWDPDLLRRNNRDDLGYQSIQPQTDRTSSDRFNINTAFTTTQLNFNHDISGNPDARTSKAFPCGCYNMFSRDFQDIAYYTRYVESQESELEWASTKILAKMLTALTGSKTRSIFNPLQWYSWSKLMLNPAQMVRWAKETDYTTDEKAMANFVVRRLYRLGVQNLLSRFAVPMALLTLAPIGPTLSFALIPIWLGIHMAIGRSLTKDQGMGIKSLNPKVFATAMSELSSYVATGVAVGATTLALASALPASTAVVTLTMVALAGGLIGRFAIMNTVMNVWRDRRPEFFESYDKDAMARMAPKNHGQFERAAGDFLAVQGYWEALEDSVQRSQIMANYRRLNWVSYVLGTNPIENALQTKLGQIAGRWISKSTGDGHEKTIVPLAQNWDKQAHGKTSSMISYPYMFFLNLIMPAYLLSYLQFNASLLQFPDPNIGWNFKVPFTDHHLTLGFPVIFGLLSVANMMMSRFLHTAHIRTGGLTKQDAELQHSMQYLFLQRMVGEVWDASPYLGKEKYQKFLETFDTHAPVATNKPKSYKDWLLGYNMFRSEIGYVRSMMAVFSTLGAFVANHLLNGLTQGQSLTATAVAAILGYFAVDQLYFLDRADEITRAGAEEEVQLKGKEYNNRLYGVQGWPRVAASIAANWTFYWGLGQILDVAFLAMGLPPLGSVTKFLVMAAGGVGFNSILFRAFDKVHKLNADTVKDPASDYESAHKYFARIQRERTELLGDASMQQGLIEDIGSRIDFDLSTEPKLKETFLGYKAALAGANIKVADKPNLRWQKVSEFLTGSGLSLATAESAGLLAKYENVMALDMNEQDIRVEFLRDIQSLKETTHLDQAELDQLMAVLVGSQAEFTRQQEKLAELKQLTALAADESRMIDELLTHSDSQSGLTLAEHLLERKVVRNEATPEDALNLMSLRMKSGKRAVALDLFRDRLRQDQKGFSQSTSTYLSDTQILNADQKNEALVWLAQYGFASEENILNSVNVLGHHQDLLAALNVVRQGLQRFPTSQALRSLQRSIEGRLENEFVTAAETARALPDSRSKTRRMMLRVVPFMRRFARGEEPADRAVKILSEGLAEMSGNSQLKTQMERYLKEAKRLKESKGNK